MAQQTSNSINNHHMSYSRIIEVLGIRERLEMRFPVFHHPQLSLAVDVFTDLWTILNSRRKVSLFKLKISMIQNPQRAIFCREYESISFKLQKTANSHYCK